MNTAFRAATALAAALTAVACGGGDKPAAEAPAAASASTAPAAATAEQTASAPAIEAQLRKLYAGYADGAAPDAMPAMFDPESADQWLSPEFAGVVKSAHTRTEGTDWPLDADPVIQAQDFGQVAVVAVDTEETGPTTATSKVRFNNFGSEQTTTFMMAKAGDRWLIDDIQRPAYEETSLKAAFRAAAPPT